MARSAAGRRPKPVTAPHHGRRAPAPPRQPKPEDLMFFPRLRTHAKWMFVFLALVFGVGFVVFGVGSSLSGTGLGDLLRNNGSSSGGPPGLSAAQKEIQKNPKQAKGYLDAANAYQTKGNIDSAIPLLAKAAQLEPKNQNTLQQLASLYATQASNASAVQQQASQDYSNASGLSFLQGGPAGQLFQSGTLDATVQADAQARQQAASQKMNAAYRNAADAYGRLTKLSPRDSQLWFLYALASESASNYPQAITAYKQFLKLSPDAPEAAQVKARIKALKQQGSSSSGGSTTVGSGGVTTITR